MYLTEVTEEWKRQTSTRKVMCHYFSLRFLILLSAQSLQSGELTSRYEDLINTCLGKEMLEVLESKEKVAQVGNSKTY